MIFEFLAVFLIWTAGCGANKPVSVKTPESQPNEQTPVQETYPKRLPSSNTPAAAETGIPFYPGSVTQDTNKIDVGGDGKLVGITQWTIETSDKFQTVVDWYASKLSSLPDFKNDPWADGSQEWTAESGNITKTIHVRDMQNGYTDVSITYAKRSPT